MNVQQMVESLTVPDGGFSVDVVIGQAVTHGYAVSTHPQFERRVQWPVTEDDLLNYASDHADVLLGAGLVKVFGGWRDPVSGDVFLDVSTVVETAHEAERLAARGGQLAYFDFATAQSVSVSTVPA